MQTFAPYPNDRGCSCLDNKRLFNQFNEHAVIWNAVVENAMPWSQHPACVMWRGDVVPGAPFRPATYRWALAKYGLWIHHELCVRNMKWGAAHYARLTEAMWRMDTQEDPAPAVFPAWWGHRAFHTAHQRNLMRKDPKFYAKFGVEPDDAYVWPLQHADGTWELRTKRVGPHTYVAGLHIPKEIMP